MVHNPFLPLGIRRLGFRVGFLGFEAVPRWQVTRHSVSPSFRPPSIAQVTHCIVAGKTKVFWDTVVGISCWRTAVGLLQSLAWQSVLEYYWHRLVSDGRLQNKTVPSAPSPRVWIDRELDISS